MSANFQENNISLHLLSNYLMVHVVRLLDNRIMLIKENGWLI